MKRNRGSIAVELALSLPIFVLIMIGSLILGRTLLAKHNLESAATAETRAAAIAGRTNAAEISAGIKRRLGGQIEVCDPQVQAVVVPGNPRILEVTAECAPEFGLAYKSIGVGEISVVVAMPLPPTPE